MFDIIFVEKHCFNQRGISFSRNDKNGSGRVIIGYVPEISIFVLQQKKGLHKKR